MTDREKAIVMAYTGIAMLSGDKINEFYKYLDELYGRPVYTHEIAILDIQSKAKQDFIELCRTQEKEEKWIPCTKRLPEEHDSIWKKAKGTDRWTKGMWEMQSDDVIVSVVFEDGTMTTQTARTHDGEWYFGTIAILRKVMAWMPLPEPWKVQADIKNS